MTLRISLSPAVFAECTFPIHAFGSIIASLGSVTSAFLLSLVTGLAHYLKLLIRISLQGALKLEREQLSIEGLHHFLADLENLNSIKEAATYDLNARVAGLSDQQSDVCHRCKEAIDDECIKLDQQSWRL